MLKYSQPDRQTEAQKAVVETLNAQIKAEIDLCIAQIKAANRAVCNLPYINEEGIKVTHGANMVMYGVAQYWVSRLNCLEIALGQSFRRYTEDRTSADISSDARKLATLSNTTE